MSIKNALRIIQVRGNERREAVRLSREMIERQVHQLIRLVDDTLDVTLVGRL